jgi:hypothetical protein
MSRLLIMRGGSEFELEFISKLQGCRLTAGQDTFTERHTTGTGPTKAQGFDMNS